MLGIGLKLLGIGKFIREFFLANWKWLVPIIVSIFLVWQAWSWHSDKVEQAYANGVVAERSIWLNKIDEENARNRQLETNLANVVDGAVEKAVNEASERTKTSNTHTNTIRTIVQQDIKYEQCLVDQSVLDEINSIRKLGPK